MAEPWTEDQMPHQVPASYTGGQLATLTSTLASTDECTTSGPGVATQQWTFGRLHPGLLCNGDHHDQCLNVPDCTASKEIVMFGPSDPTGGSCVERCGCTPDPAKKCGIGPGTLDCYTNEQFGLDCTPEGCLLTSAMGAFCVVETSDETIKLQDKAKCSRKGVRHFPARFPPF